VVNGCFVEFCFAEIWIGTQGLLWKKLNNRNEADAVLHGRWKQTFVARSIPQAADRQSDADRSSGTGCMSAVAENCTDSEQSRAAGYGSVSRRSRRAIFRRLYVSWWPAADGRHPVPTGCFPQSGGRSGKKIDIPRGVAAYGESLQL